MTPQAAARRRTRSASLRLTVYGCAADEATLFRRLAPGFDAALRITEAPVSEANIDLAIGVRCISVGHQSPVTEPELRALHGVGVRYVSTRSAGYDHIDGAFAERVGLAVGNVAYSPDGVADYTLMLILMAVRGARSSIRRVDAHDYRLSDRRSRELRDLTVGVIGTGRIGRAVEDRLRGFGGRTLTFDPRPGSGGEHVPLELLLRESDILTLHTPLDVRTHHLLNRARIGQLRRGAVIVNTGRGALIDTVALLDALESGRLGGAALDVLEGEEGVFYAEHPDRPVGHPELLRLQQLPNVLISPHTAYYTDRALHDTVENTLLNCLAFEEETAAWAG